MGSTGVEARLRALVRDVPDFPRPGITFRDITPLLADRDALADAVDAMAAPFRDTGVDFVAGIEARGFILGGAIARELSAGFVPVRKQGRLPRDTEAAAYELEYGTAVLEVHADAVGSGATVLVVDDLIATGGTAAAAVSLVERGGGHVAGVSVLIELSALRGADLLGERTLASVLRY